MRLLIDTHVFIWWDNHDAKLPDRVLKALNDPSNEVFLSLASLWEMQIKIQLGKLTLRGELPEILQDQERLNSLLLLPITTSAVFTLGRLEHHHRDPFDRMIVAQALTGGFHLVTQDPLLAAYAVPIFW